MGANVNEENEFSDDQSTASATAQPAPTADSSTVFSPELLNIYYSRLFPYQLLHSWLSYDASSNFTPGSSKVASSTSSVLARREFSTTISIDGEEIYKRYQSFSTQSDLASAIRKQCPLKIDIGAVFNYPPKDHKSLPPGKLQPVERELVFDIDLTDYDPIRNCGCSGASICGKCWKFMIMAMEVMDRGLREDFNFKHLAWVYSGRRGVHCWVCDEGARNLSNEARGAVASYFEVTLASDKNKNAHIPHPLHPMLKRAHKILEPHFISSIITEDSHGLLATQASWTKLLLTLPDSAKPVTLELEQKWRSPQSTSSPEEKWTELKAALMSFIGKSGNPKAPKNMSNTDRLRIEHWPIETVFKYTYPRLDINVSKGMNHLLKSPFCVHPKTGRVCVPIEMENVRAFDPLTVPTLPQLMRELDEYEERNKNESNENIMYDWQKTSLRVAFENFDKLFLQPLLKDVRKSQLKERREESERRAAVVGDF
ncbi:hypothetical protein ACHAW6_005068 [Cyclotella cf. meneghiniana]